MTDLPKQDAVRGGRGWKALLFTLGERISRDNISILAAGVAFYLFVAIPSALTVVISLYGLVFNPVAVEQHVAEMAGVLPLDVIAVISGFLQTLIANPPGKLSISLALGLLVALWSTQSGISSMITALNVAYQETEYRNLWRFYASSLSITICAILFAVIALILIAVLPLTLDLLPIAGTNREVATLLRWPLVFLLIGIAIAATYRFGPARKPGTARWGFRGVVFATAAWIGTSALFTFYVANFATYNKTFGSIGAVVVVLLWLYLTTFVVLVGAEINAEFEGRSRKRGRTGRD